ncbi:MAG: hypothetical protein A2521_09290 [Deltaproteobacteria bacterium RIFOXYD12_FULL_57_12]|nr:MAG: hypothetical protein A2521_09290 [Deltaproteobacteria bacterium RIFOXYD12_FULL_57_12]
MAKVLIIKLGYSETIDAGISRIPSLGDVLRTTVLLHPLAAEQVTWLVDGAAYPLLAGNPLISRILPYNLDSVLQLQREKFDTVINLEKTPGICALADSIDARSRYGFRFNERTGEAEAGDGCADIFSLCKSPALKRANGKSWQESLLQVIGACWTGQEYILGYRPQSRVAHDVGLNRAVGAKWPNKAWPAGKWEELAGLLAGCYSYSLQQGLDNLYNYIEWVNSCRCLVTNDSLGLHIAMALRKKAVVLYGPTNPNETFFYNRAEVLYPDVEYSCIPCLAPVCDQERNCMDFIAATEVKERVDRLLTGGLKELTDEE